VSGTYNLDVVTESRAVELQPETYALVQRETQRRGVAPEHPALMPYEAANAIVRAAVAANLSAELVEEMWARIADVPVKLHALSGGAEVVAVARRLKRQSAYDAAYVALAQTLSADLWTLDGPLARNASGAGLPARLLDAERAV